MFIFHVFKFKKNSLLQIYLGYYFSLIFNFICRTAKKKECTNGYYKEKLAYNYITISHVLKWLFK